MQMREKKEKKYKRVESFKMEAEKAQHLGMRKHELSRPRTQCDNLGTNLPLKIFKK